MELDYKPLNLSYVRTLDSSEGPPSSSSKPQRVFPSAPRILIQDRMAFLLAPWAIGFAIVFRQETFIELLKCFFMLFALWCSPGQIFITPRACGRC